MTDHDLTVALNTLDISRNTEHSAVPFNPAKEVEESLVSLLRSRISKMQDDQDFEQQIKDSIIARLPEANFSELMMLLTSLQNQSNISVEKILSPFIPRVGERVPLLDTEKNKDQANMDERVFEKASKKALDALSELGKLSRVLTSLDVKPASPELKGEEEVEHK